MNVPIIETIRQSEIREREADWCARNLRPVRFVTYTTEGERMIRVTLLEIEE